MELLHQTVEKKKEHTHTHKTCNTYKTYKELCVKENCMVTGTGKKNSLAVISTKEKNNFKIQRSETNPSEADAMHKLSSHLG